MLKIINVVTELENPYYETSLSSGFDIRASVDAILNAGDVAAIPTGLFLAKPNWFVRFLSRWFVFELQIRSRSGLALKNRVNVMNSPGTVDLDYPNEIKVILHNCTQAPFVVKHGDRIAQVVVAISLRARGDVSVKNTKRTGGFGSTGK